MKLYSAVGLIMAASVFTASAGIGIGDAIVDTDVGMESTDGKTVTLDEVKGSKGLLVIFTCNHCPFVIGWQKTMVELGNTYMQKGIGVIFVNSNDPARVAGDSLEGMQKMARKQGYKFPYVVDATSGVARNFGAKKTPDVFLFNANGKLVYRGAVGEGGRQPQRGGEPWLKNALDAIVSGQKAPRSETKAVGCSIKFR